MSGVDTTTDPDLWRRPEWVGAIRSTPYHLPCWPTGLADGLGAGSLPPDLPDAPHLLLGPPPCATKPHARL